MLRALKSYWAFTNGIYKCVMLGIVPFLLVAGYVILREEQAGISLFLLWFLFVVDTESDYFFMNGVYYKGLGFPESMRCSSKYIGFIREITIVDMVRRILVYQIPFVMEYIFAIGNEERMQWCRINSFWPWLEILVAQCVVFAARHYIEWAKIHFCMVIGYCIMMVLFVFFAMVLQGSVFVNGVLVAVILAVNVGIVWYTQKKGKEGFYD